MPALCMPQKGLHIIKLVHHQGKVIDSLLTIKDLTNDKYPLQRN